MRVWWCQEHQMVQLSETNACDKGYELAETDTCRMVSMRLIPDNAETEELMAQAIGRNQWQELPVSERDMKAFRTDIKAILAALDEETP